MRTLLSSGITVLAVSALAVGCKSSGTGSSGSNTTTSTEPTEWVNFHSEVPVSPTDIDPLMSGMFGSGAQSGQFISQKEMSASFYVTSQADPATPNQVRLTFSYDDGSGTPRILATTPASFEVAKVFITAVDGAVAQMNTDVQQNNAGGEVFDLVYNVVSTQGGSLEFHVKGNSGKYTLALDVTTPHTSLDLNHVGQAASGDSPYDFVSGTVWFGMQQDEFDYFVGHAYGQGATAGQNFNNFALVPYNWLHLTVTPDIAHNIVNVGFDVVQPDGTAIPLAKAPASVMAGGTFQTLVDRAMTNMTKQEAAMPGSSTPWQIPFYYDQPSGGGVVQVIAAGAGGQFTVAYSVASPQHGLIDVPFQPYKSVSFPPPDPNATKACYQLGLPNVQQALAGVFQITFTASDVITKNLKPGQMLVGDIGCSIFHASDVTVTGPVAGAKSLEDFTVKAANLLAMPAPTYTTTTQLADGNYQILCAQYVDNNDSAADQGDPVTLPIGGFQLECNVNPVTVEFALLNPSNH